MKMKRIITMVVTAIIAFGCFGFFTGCTPRENKLIIVNWEQYIDESIFKEFEKEYYDTTGVKVKVDYRTFGSNEQLYTQMSRSNKDYDLICPSDYMIEKMIDEDMLQKVDWDKIPNAEAVNPMYFEDPNYNVFDKDHEYTVPYMTGTFGIFYNTAKGVTHADAKTWDSLRQAKFKDKVTMKDTSRDSFTLGNIFVNLNDLKTQAAKGYDADFRQKLYDVINTNDNVTVPLAKEALKQQNRNVSFKVETDSGKEDIASSNSGYALGLYWSCDAGWAMLDNLNVNTIYYNVPDEGGNLWVDGFVIPKGAVNTDAAHAFMNFICGREIAIRNMKETGGCSVITSAVTDLRQEYETDSEGLFTGKTAEWKKMFLDTVFMGENVADRCVMMRSFGNMNDTIENAWLDVLR